MTYDTNPNKLAAGCAVAALILAIAGTAGSLWLSMAMQLKACPLCLYQRTFMMAVAGMLLVGLMTPLRGSSLLSLLALPATIGGLGVAAFHEYLEATSTLECPNGLFGLGTAPQQSLATFIFLTIALAAGTWWGSQRKGAELAAGVTAVVVGLLFSIGTILSAPPMPPPPGKAYEQPPEICRPPFRGVDRRAARQEG